MSRAALASSDRTNLTILADFATDTGSLNTAANATGAAVTNAVDGACRCSWTSATSGQHTGVKFENATGTWDLSRAEGIAVELGDAGEWSYNTRFSLYLLSDSGSTFTNYYEKTGIQNGVWKPGRYTLFFNKADFSLVNAGSWSSIKRVELRMLAGGTVSAQSCDVFRIAGAARGRTKVAVTFDDAHGSVYSLGYGITAGGLGDYGIPATLYVPVTNIGASTYMTLAQLKTLQAAGWTIGSHGYNHVNYAYQATGSQTEGTATLTLSGSTNPFAIGDTVTVTADPLMVAYAGDVVLTGRNATTISYEVDPGTAATLVGRVVVSNAALYARAVADLQSSMAYFSANGFTEALKHFSYPYSGSSREIVSLLRDQGYQTARFAESLLTPNSYAASMALMRDEGWMYLPMMPLGNTDTAASILAAINTRATTFGATCILVAHTIVDSASTGLQFEDDEWLTLCAGLKALQDRGIIECVSMDELYKMQATPSRISESTGRVTA